MLVGVRTRASLLARRTAVAAACISVALACAAGNAGAVDSAPSGGVAANATCTPGTQCIEETPSNQLPANSSEPATVSQNASVEGENQELISWLLDALGVLLVGWLLLALARRIGRRRPPEASDEPL